MAHERPSRLRAAFTAIIEARSRQAQAYVNSALLALDDETLTSYGYSREQLKRRPTGSYPF